MLDEINEFEQYTCNPSASNRLKPYFIIKSRGGLPRALTVIARHYLYNEYKYNELTDSDKKKEAREKTKCILAAWCGFDYTNDEASIKDANADKLKNWLPDYLKNKDSDVLGEEVAKKWNVKEQKDLYQLSNHTFFSINGINFYSIIADAINDGPLKNNVLIFKKDFFSLIKNGGKISFGKYEFVSRFLCIIAAYLLADGTDTPGGKQIQLNNIDLANWMGYQPFGQGSKKDSFFPKVKDYLTAEGSLYTIEKDFLQEYDFKIVSSDDDTFDCEEYYRFSGEIISSDELKKLKKGAK